MELSNARHLYTGEVTILLGYENLANYLELHTEHLKILHIILPNHVMFHIVCIMLCLISKIIFISLVFHYMKILKFFLLPFFSTEIYTIFIFVTRHRQQPKFSKNLVK